MFLVVWFYGFEEVYESFVGLFFYSLSDMLGINDFEVDEIGILGFEELYDREVFVFEFGWYILRG